MRQHSASVRDEERQELELFWREPDVDRAALNAAPIEVDRQITPSELPMERGLAAE